jgi:hypothetical protein
MHLYTKIKKYIAAANFILAAVVFLPFIFVLIVM